MANHFNRQRFLVSNQKQNGNAQFQMTPERLFKSALRAVNDLLNGHENEPRRDQSDKRFKSSSSQRGIPFVYMDRSRQ